MGLRLLCWGWWHSLRASLSNRNAIGIDLDKKYMQAYKDANKYLGLKEQNF